MRLLQEITINIRGRTATAILVRNSNCKGTLNIVYYWVFAGDGTPPRKIVLLASDLEPEELDDIEFQAAQEWDDFYKVDNVRCAMDWYNYASKKRLADMAHEAEAIESLPKPPKQITKKDLQRLDKESKAWRREFEELTNDLGKCPKCGGPADNGNDRCVPPAPYVCTRCTQRRTISK